MTGFELKAKEIRSINGLRFEKDGVGNISKILVQCEVNMGKMGLPLEVNIYPHLNDAQKDRAKQLLSGIENIVEKMIVTGELSID